ncbi:MAG: hypothetical protein M3Q23_14630 [Actinomycetota bacterium]|nr:hypothetical protein [Actinomycetota bacterium]
MRRLSRWRSSRFVVGRVAVFAAVGLIGALIAAPGAVAASHTPRGTAARRAAPASANWKSCASADLLCAEVQDSEEVFGEGTYVGHDEPSVLFYSSQPGSGNSVQYNITVPSDPAGPVSLSKSYNIMLHPAFWFGMALCDTFSYPVLVNTCRPDSDTNILDPAVSPYHSGSAFTELQFYPPGYVKQFTGYSCDPTKWCAALLTFGLSERPTTGQFLNPVCAGEILGGVEYTNFAYLTKSGIPQGPPDPLHFDFEASGNPGPDVLYMNQGDKISLTEHDTRHGLQAVITDFTTGETGSMMASAANGFGHIKFVPNGTRCDEVSYDYHPMYSTSSPDTRVIWAAHSYNVAFSDEIGHWDDCTAVDGEGGSCVGLEGAPGDQEAADGDDNYCFSPALSLLYPFTTCLDTNSGFDGRSYLPDWPDGNPNHPTPVLFTARTGVNSNVRYEHAAFEADTPRIEAADFGGLCNRDTGSGCTIVPRTDDPGRPLATFYPYFSTVNTQENNCAWAIGGALPNTISDYGKQSQYGALLPLHYIQFGGGGAYITRFNDYRNVLPDSPC